MNDTIDLFTYYSMLQISNLKDIKKISKIEKKIINRIKKYTDSDDIIIYNFCEDDNKYSICKDNSTNKFYLLKTDDSDLEEESAMKFIENYFDLFLYFFEQKDRNDDVFYEYTAMTNKEGNLIIIETFENYEKLNYTDTKESNKMKVLL